ncbi:hypothetical protein UPYG_G00004100 [Umbra pygmaea]|uniref:Fanconi Anaemia group E protein C-terminal domain-containing protein n=1 Tax=Umbra pygmaea TaxID=75934 RepID=A0ABD0XJK0_UMBPY
MDTHALLSRFDGRSRLLLLSLLSGATGASRALSVFQRQRRSEPDSCLHTCLESLCQHEIFPTNGATTLITKPLVSLFPVAFQRNLLSFLHLALPVLPGTIVLRLLDCLSQGELDPWVSALVLQLQRDLGASGVKESLFTPQCTDRLRGLCDRLKDGGGTATGWASYLHRPPEPASQSGLDVVLSQNKRKSSCVDLDSDPGEDSGQQSKRMKTGYSPASETTDGLKGQDSGRVSDVTESRGEAELQPSEGAPSPSSDLPQHVLASIPQIKELLQSEIEEWDQSSLDVFKVLNDCDPSQVELLCGRLGLSETPEQNLPQLCSCLLAHQPDLSHSTALTLINKLFLKKVMSLSEPASRCLVTAVMLLCSRYPRPTCQALIGPVLEEGQPGSAQIELLNRLIEDCLDPPYRLLVFQITLKGVWSEGLLSVIHALLDNKLELNEELFTLLIEQLCSQAPGFIKSMKFAKMMLTVLTKYDVHLNTTHQRALSHCLTSNQTFLKKSLQAALKRITN